MRLKNNKKGESLVGDLNTNIILKEQINEEDFKKLRALEELCNRQDKTSLKLELDFKKSLHKKNTFIKDINEFIYRIDDTIIGYLGINCFGGGRAELNGMVHPDYRRKGVFKRLLKLVSSELTRRDHEVALLLSDHSSIEGIEFIKNTGAKYSFSEYKMYLNERIDKSKGIGISLRKACNSEFLEIASMDAVFFGVENEPTAVPLPEVEELDNEITYIAEKDSKVIGKIRLDFNGNTVGIYGFGVIPEFRGKGYGREILNLILDKAEVMNPECVYLEVASENKNALNLYKSCGFEEKSVMDYYELEL
jgi:GNAT superfamily N-acetyltransferase